VLYVVGCALKAQGTTMKAKKVRSAIEEEQEMLRLVEEQLAREAELRKADTWKQKLFGSGTVTAKNPSGRYGYVAEALVLLIGIPLFGLLYHLSFTWLAIPLLLIAYGISRLVKGRRRL
jgi:hypothetical protein